MAEKKTTKKKAEQTAPEPETTEPVVPEVVETPAPPSTEGES